MPRRGPDRFELPHPSLPHSGSFMGLFCPIVLILLSTVDRIWYQFTMSNAITSQLIGNDLPWLTSMRPQQPMPGFLVIDQHHLMVDHFNKVSWEEIRKLETLPHQGAPGLYGRVLCPACASTCSHLGPL